MSDPLLGFHVGYLIVSKALDRVSTWDTITPDTQLKKVLTTKATRQQFCSAIDDIVQEYSTATITVPMFETMSNPTIADVTEIVAKLPGASWTSSLGELAGDSGTKRPG